MLDVLKPELANAQKQLEITTKQLFQAKFDLQSAEGEIKRITASQEITKQELDTTLKTLKQVDPNKKIKIKIKIKSKTKQQQPKKNNKTKPK